MNEKGADNKTSRRKLKNKITTLVKKAFELHESGCEVLLIVKCTETNSWVQYCSSDSEQLFFGYQNSKNLLNSTEEYNNSSFATPSKSYNTLVDSMDLLPSKVAKTKDLFSDFQTIKSAGSEKHEFKPSKSVISTEISTTVGPDPFPPIKEMQTNKPFISEGAKPKVEEESSPDFDFDSYFSANVS